MDQELEGACYTISMIADRRHFGKIGGKPPVCFQAAIDGKHTFVQAVGQDHHPVTGWIRPYSSLRGRPAVSAAANHHSRQTPTPQAAKTKNTAAGDF